MMDTTNGVDVVFVGCLWAKRASRCNTVMRLQNQLLLMGRYHSPSRGASHRRLNAFLRKSMCHWHHHLADVIMTEDFGLWNTANVYSSSKFEARIWILLRASWTGIIDHYRSWPTTCQWMAVQICVIVNSLFSRQNANKKPWWAHT